MDYEILTDAAGGLGRVIELIARDRSRLVICQWPTAGQFSPHVQMTVLAISAGGPGHTAGATCHYAPDLDDRLLAAAADGPAGRPAEVLIDAMAERATGPVFDLLANIRITRRESKWPA